METAAAGDWSQIILYQRERGEESISERVRIKRVIQTISIFHDFPTQILNYLLIYEKKFLREAITYASDVL